MISVPFMKRSFSEWERKHGKQVWKELDARLPEAVGVVEDDRQREAEFALLVKGLSARETYCLRKWLEHQVYDLQYNFDEHTCSSAEAYERKWLQIYNRHLALLS